MIVSINLDDLASQEPVFAALREQAQRLGLSWATARRCERKRGTTIRIVFRSPRHRKGDDELIYFYREPGRKR